MPYCCSPNEDTKDPSVGEVVAGARVVVSAVRAGGIGSAKWSLNPVRMAWANP